MLLVRLLVSGNCFVSKLLPWHDGVHPACKLQVDSEVEVKLKNSKFLVPAEKTAQTSTKDTAIMC